MSRSLSSVRCMLVLAVVLVATYAPWMGMSPVAQAAGLPVAGFVWEMLPRFPENLVDGVPVMPNNQEYADPATFGVLFAGCTSSSPSGPIVGYQWQVRQNGIDVHPNMTTNGCTMLTQLAQGKYDVSLTVTDPTGQTALTTQSVTVKDYLIVAIGDSYGSGQGNPDVRGHYSIPALPWPIDYPAKWMDERCNRSSYAGAYQAAKRLEHSDPHTSVTFVFLSCSGATIARGLIGPYAGANPPFAAPDLPPQVDQVQGIVGARTIDALLVSIGGNDVRFPSIAAECIWNAGCWGHVEDGLTLAERVPLWLRELTGWSDGQGNGFEGWYSKLATQIATKLRVRNIYLSEYPNSMHDYNGDICPSMLNDILPSCEITRDEAAWLEEHFARPLNAAVVSQAQHWGWHPVTGISTPFEGVLNDPNRRGHGYCSSERWIRTAEESHYWQGGGRVGTIGTLHPNELGHQVYARALYDAVHADLPGGTNRGTSVVVTPEGAGSLPGPFYVWFNNVKEPGVTRVEISTGSVPPPAGFRLGDPGIVYDITTTAQFEGGARTCVNYSGQAFADENSLKFYHWENDAWVDRTYSLDTENNVICAMTTSLSPFAVFQQNRPPTALPGGPYAVNEGATIGLSGAGSDPESDALSYAWDLNNDGTYETAGQEATFSAEALDGPTSKTVGLKVCDTYAACATTAATVEVKNAVPAPTIGNLPAGSVGESTAVALTASATDAGAADVTAGFTFAWDVKKDDVAFASGSGVDFSFTPDDNGAYTVSLLATDKDGGTGSATQKITIDNVAPALNNLAANSATVNEGGSVTLSGDISDAGSADSFSLEIDWGDGGAAQTVAQAAGSASFSVAHTYADDDPTATASDEKTISVKLSDDDGAANSQSTTVMVNNENPVMTITAPWESMLFPLTDAINVSATFADAGANDTWSCDVTWDDGTTAAGTVTNGACTAGKTYTAAGIYSIQAKVTDDDLGSDTKTVMIVVYDPSAGFVTGAGFIDSPAGAYTVDPTLAGPARFALVSKYQKGAQVPSGQTQFEFKVADFRFNATAYDWLVVAGPKAQYKGTGTVNGEGNYGFLLTLTDGQINGGGDVDKFRIKIWNDGGVVYDNVLDASEDMDAANPQAITNGNVVIHH